MDDVYAQASTIKPNGILLLIPDSLNDLGVSTMNLARTLNIATQEKSLHFYSGSGRTLHQSTNGKDIRNDIQSIYNLEVPSLKGFNVPINYVAKIYAKSGPPKSLKGTKEICYC